MVDAIEGREHADSREAILGFLVEPISFVSFNASSTELSASCGRLATSATRRAVGETRPHARVLRVRSETRHELLGLREQGVCLCYVAGYRRDPRR